MTVVIPLLATVARESRGAEPLTFGVPLARGQVRDSVRTVLVTGDDRRPVQATPLAHWPDGSVKWLLAECLSPAWGIGRHACSLVVESGAPLSTSALDVRSEDDAISIHTGMSRFVFGSGSKRSSDVVRVFAAGGRELGALQLVFRDKRQKEAEIVFSQAKLTSAGALRATVELSGRVRRHRDLNVRLRLSFFAGRGLLRVETMIHNARAARHSGGLWDLGDSGSCLFGELALRYRAKLPLHDAKVHINDEHRLALRAGQRGALVQHSSGGRNWRSRNHVDRHGRVPLSRWGYEWEGPGPIVTGGRASPTLVCSDEAGSVTVAAVSFWQQFPKSLAIDERNITVGLFPAEHGEPFELQGGESKRHITWLEWSDDPSASPDRLAWVHQPASICASAAWHAESGAWPCLIPAERDPDERLAAVTCQAIAGPQSFFKKREAIDEYGWRHFGEVWGDHEGAFFSGSGPVISHYNNQFDLLWGMLLQWVRTGDDAWRDVANPLAQHVVDIDIYHTTRDKPAYSGGLFWHTDHYVSAATATHRTYSRYNLRGTKQSYGGGPSNEHNYATGLLYHYYLTGDADSKRAVLELADWVLRMDDGRLAPWGWLDDGPTGNASRTRDDDFHGPGRGAGNSLNVLLDAWEVSRERRYLDFAETLVRRSIHPADDIDRLELLDVERRWSYTVFLVALVRFLTTKSAEAEFDGMHDYGRASLLHYARWMVENECPTLDQPERLQYVTESWAAQDLRKANVLRLAALFASENLASRCCEKADEISDSAWASLLSFPSAHVTRAIAIAAVEGTRDFYLRVMPPELTNPAAGTNAYGEPQRFIPPRRRLAAKLATFSGMREMAGTFLSRLRCEVSRGFKSHE